MESKLCPGESRTLRWGSERLSASRFLFLKMRAAIFIDGENFRRSLVELFGEEFPKEQYLPKKADWEGFFEFLTKKAECKERIRMAEEEI